MPATILLVDDDQAVLRLLNHVLTKNGYRVHPASDAQEAVQSFRDNPGMDLLLTDVNMPRMNGLELARELRASNPHLPVLFMSADFSVWREEVALACYISKPFNLMALLRAVESHLTLDPPGTACL